MSCSVEKILKDFESFNKIQESTLNLPEPELKFFLENIPEQVRIHLNVKLQNGIMMIGFE